MLNVYYHVAVDDGVAQITTTAKDYFDRHHCLDDGSGPDYNQIETAMERSGARRLCESVYEAAAEDADAVIANMQALGFNMISSPAFDAMLNLE